MIVNLFVEGSRVCGGVAAVLCGVRCARFHSIPHARTRHQSSLSFLLAKILCCFKQVDNLERANKEVSKQLLQK